MPFQALGAAMPFLCGFAGLFQPGEHGGSALGCVVSCRHVEAAMFGLQDRLKVQRVVVSPVIVLVVDIKPRRDRTKIISPYAPVKKPLIDILPTRLEIASSRLYVEPLAFIFHKFALRHLPPIAFGFAISSYANVDGS
jgi:hypothetical protein